MSGSRRLSDLQHRRAWRFADCEFDEGRWRLTVDGRPVELEIKPLELLREFLARPGEVLTKDELLEAVWPETTVVEGSLTTAISKLRKALGPRGGDLIATVARIGYRMTCEVTSAEAPSPRATLGLKEGQAVPGRPQWRLAQRLGGSAAAEVWRAEHPKTGELRIFKFATEPAWLRLLKREAALSRLLTATLGDRPDLAPVLEWNFETPPFFLEAAYRGEDLLAWAARQGGLAQIPLNARLDIAAQVAETTATAHGLGVLHRDLKPGNVVVSRDGGGWRAAVVDFGSAALLEPERLASLAITNAGFDGAEGQDSAGGTALYLAPERHAGGPASVSSDIFALGVLLYQLVVADFSRPLAAGWERDVPDPLLRDDIAETAASSPDHRIASAGALATRLRTLDARRQARTQTEAEAAERVALATEVMKTRARRPWVMLAGGALAAGLAASSALYLEARRDRDVAQQVSNFLANDLLARSSPFKSGKADETLVAAVTAASPAIDRRFTREPAVAARLHQTIAHALDRRSDWTDARAEYQRAAELWTKAVGPNAVQTRVVRLQTAMMEARSYQAGGLSRAKAILAEQAPAVDAMTPAPPELKVWLASARGMVALVGDDAKTAAEQFGLAATAADAHPQLFDEGERLTFLQRLAFAHIRLGDGAGAATLFRRLADGYGRLEGPDGPDVLMVRMNLVQALMIQARHAEAVEEAGRLYPKLLTTLGPENEMTLQLLSTRAQSEGALERWDAAIADTGLVHKVAVSKQGEGSFFALASATDGATAKCRAGRRPQALDELGAAWRTAHGAFPGSALEGAIAYAWGACLIADGQVDAGAAKLAGIDRKAVAQLAGDPDWGANLDLAWAQVAFAHGDLPAARRALDTAAPAFAKPTAEAYQVRAYRLLREKLAS